MNFHTYTLHNFRDITQMQKVSEEIKFNIEVVGHVLPFKTNNYVIDNLIDWDNYENEPIYNLNFPRKGMLKPEHFNTIAKLLKSGAKKTEIKKAANEIRLTLNPQPDGQLEHNVPELNGVKLTGIQHKYRETMLFFPTQGQTCHAYCTFCFRWPQFVGMGELKFAMKQSDLMIEYLKQHPDITDILFTGGDPLVMKTKVLESYINPLLEADLPNLKTIRIGTKALAFCPQRFLTNPDGDDLLRLFEKVNNSKKILAIMAHFSHPKELETDDVQKAIKKIRDSGAQIRSQSPVLRNINADAEIWKKMWRKQVDLGIIPYYMFIARDTGAQHYFGIPLVKAWEIFKDAYSQVSGICRTVRGPSMSTDPGKIVISGISYLKDTKLIALKFIQGRNPGWIGRPFFAEYNDKAIWLSDLKPAFGKKEFFYEQEFKELFEH